MAEHPTERIEIELAYDGSAVADGTMDVRDLAPALFAVGDLFEVTNLVFNGRASTVAVNLRAIRSGSFDMVLQVLMDMAGSFMSSGVPDGWKSVWELRDLLFGPNGVIGAILPNKPDQPVNRDVQRLLDNDAVRQPIEEIVRPLRRTGIHTLNIFVGGQHTFTINQYGTEALPDLSAALPGESKPWETRLEVADTATVELEVIRPALRGKGAWRFSDGVSEFSATMRDEEFRQSVVDQGTQFANGDTLLCDLRTVHRRPRRGVRTRYYVMRVWEHRRANGEAA